MSYTGVILYLVPKGKVDEKLKRFCKKMDIDFEEATKILKEKGIKFQADETLLSIARRNNVSPSFIHSLIEF